MSERLVALPDAECGPPADPVTFDVAEALLGVPVPPALREVLVAADGVRLGPTTLFDVDRLIEVTTAGAHSWQLPGHLVVGAAGADRALVMHPDRAVVDEVDGTTWDPATLRESADSPADLFLVHAGLPIAERAADWALPGLASALPGVLVRAEADVARLEEIGLGSRSTDLGVDRTAFTDDVLAYRPDPPRPGVVAGLAWATACNDVAVWFTEHLRDRVHVLAVPAAAADQVEQARSLAHLVILAAARERLADAVGPERVPGAPGERLLAELHAGRLPAGWPGPR